MAEYIEREAAISALRLVKVGEASINFPAAMLTELKAIPAADVVEVVRCRDCRYRDPEDKKCDSGELERAGCIFPVDDDYFCAYGKRKDGGQDDG